MERSREIDLSDESEIYMLQMEILTIAKFPISISNLAISFGLMSFENVKHNNIFLSHLNYWIKECLTFDHFRKFKYNNCYNVVKFVWKRFMINHRNFLLIVAFSNRYSSKIWHSFPYNITDAVYQIVLYPSNTVLLFEETDDDDDHCCLRYCYWGILFKKCIK